MNQHTATHSAATAALTTTDDHAKQQKKKKEPKARKWEEELQQSAMAWCRTFLVQCIDIAMMVFPPPPGFMQLLIKNKDRPSVVRSLSSTKPRRKKQKTSKKPDLWHAEDVDDDKKDEDDNNENDTDTLSEELELDQDLANHDPCDSDFVPDGDKHNLEGYQVLSKRDKITGIQRTFLKKGKVLTESIDVTNKEESDADKRQIDVENAMDVPNAEDKAFVVDDDDNNDDNDSDGSEKYPDDEGGADSPIRNPKKKLKLPSKKKSAVVDDKSTDKSVDKNLIIQSNLSNNIGFASKPPTKRLPRLPTPPPKGPKDPGYRFSKEPILGTFTKEPIPGTFTKEPGIGTSVQHKRKQVTEAREAREATQATQPSPLSRPLKRLRKLSDVDN